MRYRMKVQCQLVCIPGRKSSEVSPPQWRHRQCLAVARSGFAARRNAPWYGQGTAGWWPHCEDPDFAAKKINYERFSIRQNIAEGANESPGPAIRVTVVLILELLHQAKFEKLAVRLAQGFTAFSGNRSRNRRGRDETNHEIHEIH